jgi:hypothetical protein
MVGFREIPAGVEGVCSNKFTFTGGSGHAFYSTKLTGTGNFDLKSDPGLESWSPCGGSTAILNMNTQCSINPTNKPALIAVSSRSG